MSQTVVRQSQVTDAQLRYARFRLYKFMDDTKDVPAFEGKVRNRTRATTSPGKLRAWFLVLESDNFHSLAREVLVKLESL